MLTYSKVFEQVGGYDPKLRDHDIQDLAIRLHEAGKQGYFDPSISAIHTAVQVRHGNRNSSMAAAEFYIARKHGLLKWLTAK
ncbi:MAG TPA: hypothetical protein VHC21_03010 [Candidatus Saccharimonadales bacterium]|nr:hypothetical protein [Candidatus Saccharimonadales bacterium]